MTRACKSAAAGDARPVSLATAAAYVLLITVLAKLVRALDIAAPMGLSLTLALSLAQDLLVAAGLLALLHLWCALARAARAQAAAVFGLVTPWALLVVMDVMSWRLTGAGITWQRLRGDEGATLKDLALLSPIDLGLAIACTAGAFALLPALWWACRRFERARALSSRGVVLVLALVASALLGVQQAVDFETQGLEDNPFVLLLQGADDEPLVLADGQPGTMEEDGWRRLHRLDSPAEPRDVDIPPVPAEKLRNVIVFFAEGIPARYTSFGSAGLDTTPNLKRRFESEGLLFERFYSHFHSSIQSIFSLVCSAYPPLSLKQGHVVAQHARIDCGELSEHLRRGGRRVGLFHGGRFAYYEKLSLLGGRGYEVTLDAEGLSRRYPERETTKWGIDDRALVDSTLAWIDELPEDQPFGAVLIPITAHYPYWIPDDVEPRFPGKDRREQFASAVSFLDEVLEALLSGLAERGLYDDTLVVVLADHGERVDPLVHRRPGFRVAYEQNLRVPLVLLSPRLFGGLEERRTERMGGIIDVQPTVLDALGLPEDPRHFGQSLLSPRYEPRRVFFGASSGRRSYVGLVERERKFVLQLKDRDAEIYDVDADPDEQLDLAPSSPEEVKRLRSDALRFFTANRAWFKTTPSLPAAQDIHERAAREGRVSLARDDGAAPMPCLQDDKEWRCGDAAPAPTVWVGHRDKDESRPCLRVAVPPSPARLSLTVRSDSLQLIGAVRLGHAPGVKGKKDDVRARVAVDGEEVGAHHVKPKPKPKRMEMVAVPTAQEELRVTLWADSESGPQEVCLVLSAYDTGGL